jgi:hypothetical protein
VYRQHKDLLEEFTRNYNSTVESALQCNTGRALKMLFKGIQDSRSPRSISQRSGSANALLRDLSLAHMQGEKYRLLFPSVR